MSILEKIIAEKREEVVRRKLLLPEEHLIRKEGFERITISLKQALLKKRSSGIIAEFKRKSPSQGWINQVAEVYQVVPEYELYGAAGVSVLTDEMFFGGSLSDLLNARLVLEGPLLRKDFIIDEYQVIETKAWGADVLLLIAACLSPRQVRRLSLLAKQTGLEVLLEIHDETELGHLCDSVDIVGINNRNLKTFETDIQTSLHLAEKLPDDTVLISESGISQTGAIRLLRKYGFRGFLIGEHFMKEADPGLALKNFIDKLNDIAPGTGVQKEGI